MNAKLLALELLVTLGATGAAGAQSVHFSYGQQTRYGEVSLSLSAPLAGGCRPARVWVPGHYERVEQRVWVEGGERREWVPPVHETRFDECGRPYSVLAREGHWITLCERGRFELRTVNLWVDGYWRGEPLARAPAVELGSRHGRFDGYRYDGRRP